MLPRNASKFSVLNKQYAAREALLGEVKYNAPSSTIKHPALGRDDKPDDKPKTNQEDTSAKTQERQPAE